MLQARKAGVTRWSGGTVVLRAGQSISEDHPLVKERPDLFEESDGEPDIKSAPEGRTRNRTEVVETATRAPGERRMLPRRGGGSTSE